ncbi:hypothetical protein A134_23220 [Vibrio crassostreae 9CS106]|uniref:Uncharacterized protein n=1 Tax=Vibrio crassostreae 9CS106 TaxID=1191300 RepID=A0A1B1C394_9VIBR|nr:hypothetical protein A134_23220 [Vibrio crassostreae 9CS106]
MDTVINQVTALLVAFGNQSADEYNEIVDTCESLQSELETERTKVVSLAPDLEERLRNTIVHLENRVEEEMNLHTATKKDLVAAKKECEQLKNDRLTFQNSCQTDYKNEVRLHKETKQALDKESTRNTSLAGQAAKAQEYQAALQSEKKAHTKTSNQLSVANKDLNRIKSKQTRNATADKARDATNAQLTDNLSKTVRERIMAEKVAAEAINYNNILAIKLCEICQPIVCEDDDYAVMVSQHMDTITIEDTTVNRRPLILLHKSSGASRLITLDLDNELCIAVSPKGGVRLPKALSPIVEDWLEKAKNNNWEMTDELLCVDRTLETSGSDVLSHSKLKEHFLPNIRH